MCRNGVIAFGGYALRGFSDDLRGRGSPDWQQNEFDFDQDSRQDILDGARRAKNEIENGLTTCGCGK